MKNQIKNILESKKLVINNYLISISIEKELTLNEFLVLVYLDNDFSKTFDLELISKTLGLDTNQVMEAFNNLMVKNLVNLETIRDLNSKVNETVNLDNLYNLIIGNKMEESKKETEDNIYKTFESELGRTISSNELTIIDGWLSTGASEEIVLGALREAMYNGVPRFRYIDQIIYEWNEKGFKTMEDVKNYMKSNREAKDKDEVISKKEKDILDFDWINNDN